MSIPSQDTPSYAPNSSFNPLGLAQLSENLRGALEGQPKRALDGLPSFKGAGLYALYYRGDLPLYEGLMATGAPLYVGKAEAGNSSYGDPPNEVKPKLYKRIDKHRTSIQEADNLSVGDFDVRYLLLDDVWIVLGERALLRAYSPVLWNTLLTGFGSNPAGTARTNPRSFWDTLHPGRPRAAKYWCNRSLTRHEIEERVRGGVAISQMEPGVERAQALADLRARRYPRVWALASKQDKVRSPIVYRPEEFVLENAAFGVQVKPEAWRKTHTSEVAEAEVVVDEAEEDAEQDSDD